MWRFLWSLFTLWVVSVVVFHLGQWATPDPVAKREMVVEYDYQEPADMARRYASAAAGWADKPLFYVEMGSSARPDTAYKIFPPARRERLLYLADRSGHWPVVARWDAAISKAIRRIERDSVWRNESAFQHPIKMLAQAKSIEAADSSIAALRQLVQPRTVPELDSLVAAGQILAQTRQMAWPRLRWHGLQNQYHDWLRGLFGGKHTGPGRSVWRDLRFPLYNTMLVSGLALLLALVFAIPLGVYAAQRQNRPAGKALRWWWLMLYAMPVMLIGCILRFGFATPGHGWHIGWIGGVSASSYDPDGGWWPWVTANFRKMILPILAIMIHTLALLVLQVRTGMLEVLGRDFIRTARAKGLSERAVIWRHALPNALFPLITTLGMLLPSIVGGSLVTEAIFKFHGVGEVMLDAFSNGNTPVMMAVVLLISAVTLIGAGLSEWLYRRVDPRVK
jgi:peptide/nickel transport system permease protein